MSRSKQPLTIEHAILGFLHEQPLHGYEVYQRLGAAETLGSVWPLKQSQFYALVTRLEAEGYLSISLEPRGSLPPRKVLQLTPAGAAAFAGWLYTPANPGDDPQPVFLARLYFARQAGPAAVYQLLVNQRRQSRAQLHELRRDLQEHATPQSYLWLVRQWQIRQTEAILDWLDTFGPLPQPASGVAYPIAVIADSPVAALARAFVAYLCGPLGQGLLVRYGFLPASECLSLERGLPAPAAPLSGELVIYAAASLTAAFEALSRAFSAAHPQVSIRCIFGGSQALANALIQGERADIYASAHQNAMDLLIVNGRVLAGSVRTFAHNQLAIVTPMQRSTPLQTLVDLASPGLRLALGSGATAIGRYTREALDNAAQAGSFGTAGADAVLHNVVYYDETVTGVLSRVVQGEVDAGIVFTSDYHRANGEVQVAVVPPLP